ncbi:MAG: c-type cytochrome [Burkholderiaceae bacterium]|jgi:putative copper resistance protein D
MVLSKGLRISVGDLRLCCYGLFVWLLAPCAFASPLPLSPVPYSVAAIAKGRTIYMSYCSQCHGDSGHGDGPRATGLHTKPADLVEHYPHHPEGQLFGWIRKGIDGTGMPSFEGSLSKTNAWEVIQFLHALSDGAILSGTNGEFEAARPIVAPDFEFAVNTQSRESLRQLRRKATVGLLFCQDEQSATRLGDSLLAKKGLGDSDVRLIVLYPRGKAAQRLHAQADPNQAITPRVGEEVYPVYSNLFSPAHTTTPFAPLVGQLVVDRRGYIRWVRTGQDLPAGEAMERFLDALARIDQDPGESVAQNASLK